jgi:hypothetical protein
MGHSGRFCPLTGNYASGDMGVDVIRMSYAFVALIIMCAVLLMPSEGGGNT